MTRLDSILSAAQRALDPRACECRECSAGVQRKADREEVATFVRDVLPLLSEWSHAHERWEVEARMNPGRPPSGVRVRATTSALLNAVRAAEAAESWDAQEGG